MGMSTKQTRVAVFKLVIETMQEGIELQKPAVDLARSNRIKS